MNIQAVLANHAKWLANPKEGTWANLSGADLRGADLRGANLPGANLLGAQLCEANLTGAVGLPDAPVVPELHRKVAGALIYHVSTGAVPDFYANKETALADIRRCAGEP